MLKQCRKILALLLLFLILAFFIPRPGFCHRINIFCWVAGNQVHCEAKFTPGGAVKNGQIAVFSQPGGEKLLTAVTDENGKAAFEIPARAVQNGWDLKVVCDAGMGHKNFWVVKADELPSAEGGPASANAKMARKGPTLAPADLEKVFSRVMRRQLAPIKRDLAELKNRPISLQDIFGGLGYIFGLAGVAFYFLAKKDKRG